MIKKLNIYILVFIFLFSLDAQRYDNSDNVRNSRSREQSSSISNQNRNPSVQINKQATSIQSSKRTSQRSNQSSKSDHSNILEYTGYNDIRELANYLLECDLSRQEKTLVNKFNAQINLTELEAGELINIVNKYKNIGVVSNARKSSRQNTRIANNKSTRQKSNTREAVRLNRYTEQNSDKKSRSSSNRISSRSSSERSRSFVQKQTSSFRAGVSDNDEDKLYYFTDNVDLLKDRVDNLQSKTEKAIEIFEQENLLINAMLETHNLVETTNRGLQALAKIPKIKTGFTVPANASKSVYQSVNSVKSKCCNADCKLENPEKWTRKTNDLLLKTSSKFEDISQKSKEIYDIMSAVYDCSMELPSNPKSVSLQNNLQSNRIYYLNQLNELAEVLDTINVNLDAASDDIDNTISDMERTMEDVIQPIFDDLDEFFSTLSIIGEIMGYTVTLPWPFDAQYAEPTCPSGEELYGGFCYKKCVGKTVEPNNIKSAGIGDTDKWVGKQRTAALTCRGEAIPYKCSNWWTLGECKVAQTLKSCPNGSCSNGNCKTWDSEDHKDYEGCPNGRCGSTSDRKCKTKDSCASYTYGNGSCPGGNCNGNKGCKYIWPLTGCDNNARRRCKSGYNCDSKANESWHWDGAYSCSGHGLFDQQPYHPGYKCPGDNYAWDDMLKPFDMCKSGSWNTSAKYTKDWTSAEEFGMTGNTTSCPSGYTNAGLTCFKGDKDLSIEIIGDELENLEEMIDQLGINQFIDNMLQEIISPITNPIADAVSGLVDEAIPDFDIDILDHELLALYMESYYLLPNQLELLKYDLELMLNLDWGGNYFLNNDCVNIEQYLGLGTYTLADLVGSLGIDLPSFPDFDFEVRSLKDILSEKINNLIEEIDELISELDDNLQSELSEYIANTSLDCGCE